MSRVLKLALLTTDAREPDKSYDRDQPYFGSAPEALIQGFAMLPEEVEVHIICCLQQQPAASPKRLASNIYYHALQVPKIGWLRTAYQGCIRKTRQKLQELQPDIVHGQGTERDCAMCAVYSGYPSVLTIHGNMRLVAKVLGAKPFTYYWFASILERHCLRRTEGVVAISSYTESNISSHTRRSWLLPNAVHPSFFGIRRQPHLPRVILCPANISTRKNQLGLIAALDPMAKETPFRLMFAGGGAADDPYFRKFMQAIADRPWCQYLGPLDRRALQDHMAQATCGVLPSFEDNCPMVVIEAAAARLPFAASGVGGVPDLIEHGVTGLMFDPHRPQSIHDAVFSIIRKASFAEQLATAAHTQAVIQFSAKQIARRHVAIYRQVMDMPGSAS